MSFSAEQKLKTQILSILGTDKLFRLLSDSSVDVLMKTLGLLRNLLSNKPHIDYIMSKHGNEIIQAVIMILEGDHPIEVKEQVGNFWKKRGIQIIIRNNKYNVVDCF